MASFVMKPRDDDMEELRNVEEPHDLDDDDVIELKKKTERVHAGFLFDSIGREARAQLCLQISSTRNNYKFAGWEEFGIRLGLNPLLIKVISHQFTKEDPTQSTLLAFVQNDDATLDKVVDALHRMGRRDVITKTRELLLALAKQALESTGSVNGALEMSMNTEESGYSSSDGQIESICGEMNVNNIIRPLWPPVAPWLFQNIGSTRISLEPYTKDQTAAVELESYQVAMPTTKKQKRQYGRTVLLTFASDGWYTAQQVAAVFRKQRENLPHIGVVILQEQSEYVNTCPEQFINGIFSQVDYVVPIITEEYLRTVVSVSQTGQSSLQGTDARYAKYIYSLMSSYYVRNGCINDKIRCVIPDSKVYFTQRHPVMASPLFQVWVRVTETEELSHRILRSKF